ncbi:MAG: ferredoxin family protein [Acidobacteriota bacterium]
MAAAAGNGDCLAFPISVLALMALPLWRQGALTLMGLVWALSLLIFLSFPLYQGRLETSGKHVGCIFFDFGRHGVVFTLWLILMLGLVGYAMLANDFTWTQTMRWGLSSMVVLLILSLDLMGSTPLYKSGLHPDRLLHIQLDTELCKGPGFCEQVCPKDVFAVDHHRHLATLLRPEQCVQCGACIVQCPFGALSFCSPTGEVVTPETVRRYKLNLLGSRMGESNHSACGTAVQP